MNKCNKTDCLHLIMKHITPCVSCSEKENGHDSNYITEKEYMASIFEDENHPVNVLNRRVMNNRIKGARNR
jgi:hypothetical protein